LISVVQTRYLVAFGWLLLACTMYLSTQQLDLAVSFQSVTWLRVLQYFPIPLIFIPTTTAAYIGVSAEKNNSVAGLINFTRNIGSGVGTSIVTTLIARQSQFHQVHLVSRLANDNPAFLAKLAGMTHRLADAGLGTWEAQRQGYARFYEMVQAQAQTLAYIDTFWLLAVGAAVMFALAFVLDRNDPRAGGSASVH
jgi:DHA2 family multidrug resistance protein